MPNLLLEWLHASVLTDEQLDTIPPGDRTSLRYLIPEINSKGTWFDDHQLGLLCVAMADIHKKELSKAEQRLYFVLHQKGLLGCENGVVKLGSYWTEKRGR